MTALARAQRWIQLFRYQPLTVRLFVAAAGILTAAAAFTAPAEASPIDDSFIGALNHAGVNYGSPANAVTMGQAVCPMLAEPGGNFAAAAARVKSNGMSPEMANMFTRIAISMYCPTMMADVAEGKMPNLPRIPGLPGL
jgi:Protein of unknown function (DUF732)